MESNQKASGDGLSGTQKEAALQALTQRTGYQLQQVGPLLPVLTCPVNTHLSILLAKLFLYLYIDFFGGGPCVSGEWPAAVRWPTARLGRPPARERERDLCGETTARPV